LLYIRAYDFNYLDDFLKFYLFFPNYTNLNIAPFPFAKGFLKFNCVLVYVVSILFISFGKDKVDSWCVLFKRRWFGLPPLFLNLVAVVCYVIVRIQQFAVVLIYLAWKGCLSMLWFVIGGCSMWICPCWWLINSFAVLYLSIRRFIP
jgi:hypothetical protein